MSDDDSQMPCGKCAAGTYAFGAVKTAIEMFGSCLDRKTALGLAPRCIHDTSKICMGARDFIIAIDFPISEAMKHEYGADAA